MFCNNVECKLEANRKFHQFECKIIDANQALSTKIMQISLRVFFEALDIFNGNVENLNAFLLNISGVSRTAFDNNYQSNENGSYRMNMLHLIDNLVTNEVNCFYMQNILNQF